MKKAYEPPKVVKVGELPKYTAVTLQKISGDYYEPEIQPR